MKVNLIRMNNNELLINKNVYIVHIVNKKNKKIEIILNINFIKFYHVIIS